MHSQQLFAGMLLSVLVFSNAQADVVITLKEGSQFVGDDASAAAAFFASSGNPKDATLWSTEGKMARFDGSRRLVGMLAQQETYILDDSAKTCQKIVHAVNATTQSDKGPDFSKTDDTRKVGVWQAQGYELSIPGNNDDGTDIALWVSSEATLGLDNYREYTKNIAPPDTGWMVTALELGGYPVRQEVRTGPLAMWSEIVSIEERDAPPGTYAVPKDYEGCQ